MRLLYLAYRLPYLPDKGERIRAFHQIRCLSKDAEITLVGPADAPPSAELLSTLHQYCRRVLVVPDSPLAAYRREIAAFLGGAPRTTRTFVSRALRSQVKHACLEHGIDRILVSTLFAAEAVRGLQGAKAVIDLVDVYSRVWLDGAERRQPGLRWLSRLEGHRLHRYESRLLGEFDTIVVSSQREAALLRARMDDANVVVVGNGVDLDYFRPGTDSPIPRPPEFVFSGSLNYGPNIDAVLFFRNAILPLVRRTYPLARFTVVGRDPVRSVRALGHDPGVEVTGTVPDVRPYLARATAAVAPMRYGQGVQNKVLEAMAMGVPVVATRVALQGLDASSTTVCGCADTPQAFAAELSALAADADLCAKRAKAARSYVETRHRWEDHCALLRRVLEAGPSRVFRG